MKKLFFLTVILALVAVTGVFASLTIPDLDSIRPIHPAQGSPVHPAQGKAWQDESEDDRECGADKLAERPAPAQGKPEESSLPEFSIWRSAGAVIFVLGALLAVNGFLRKRQGFSLKTGAKRSIKILEKLAIDHRRSLLLVEVDGKKILVGVGTERIEPIADLGDRGTQSNGVSE